MVVSALSNTLHAGVVLYRVESNPIGPSPIPCIGLKGRDYTFSIGFRYPRPAAGRDGPGSIDGGANTDVISPSPADFALKLSETQARTG